MLVPPAAAVVTVTAATGGTGISVDTAANAASPSWTSLGSITVTEGNNADFASTGCTGIGDTANLRTLILTAPAGFQFRAGVGSVTFTGTGTQTNAMGSAISVVAATVTVTLCVNGTNRTDRLTISNLQVQPTTGAASASGNILRTAANPGTATISGITNGTTNFGSLSSTSPGAPKQLVVTQQPGSATAGAAFGTQPAVAIRDQFGTTVTSDSSTAVTASLISGTGALLGMTTATASNGVATFSNLRIDTAGAKTLRFTSGALTSADSASFNVSPATAAKLVVSGSGTQTAGTTQTVTLTAQDSFGNTATGYTGAKTITFSGATASSSPVTSPTVNSTNFGSATSITFTNGT
ncbi:MAG TPA: hypothetical protein VNT58_05655, partial [Gaiellaceae bacterium]|nr:hypothetical protein [Gaiellaceae bacterium]